MKRRSSKEIRSGVGQLTLVEHALCPLDARASHVTNLIHEATFSYTPIRGKRQHATARLFCPLGLSPKDEFYLWGLLSITLLNPQLKGELFATRHYLLRRLGLIDANSRRGGRQYQDFCQAIERLSCVNYQCDAFYDPVRSEHRKVSFGFFSYSIPMDPDSNRAWRIVWDPIFFEMAQATSGSMRFDLAIYSQLDGGSRRLYLFLAKVLYRRKATHRLDVRQVTEQVLGIAPTVSLRDKVARLRRSCHRLTELGILAQADITRPFRGHFTLVAHRGARLKDPETSFEHESPLFEPLYEIGLDRRGAAQLLRRFDHRIIAEWIDITQAAQTRHGIKFFSNSPAAFLIDSVQHASRGRRTPPDWWHEIRKAEECARRERNCDAAPGNLERLGEIQGSILDRFKAPGQVPNVGKQNAHRFRQTRQRLSKTTS